ncbi:MAG: phosphatase PAP2 family protein [Bacillota bacterium]|nr:phosphatase PAP2 family protein [Bacillota bacterium]
MFEALKSFDTNILNFLHNNLQSTFMDKLMSFMTFLGNGGLIWIIISVALIISKKYRKAGIMAAAALIIGTLLGEIILKNIIKRPRPYMDMPLLQIIIPKLSTYSFPSGHTVAAFAVAGVLAKTIHKSAVPVFLLASLIAFSRAYLMMHYPSDVVAGAILGLACSWVVLRLSKNKRFKIIRIN